MKKPFNLENLIFAIILLLPTYLLRFEVFGVPTNFLECLFLFFFISFFLNRDARKKLRIFLNGCKNHIPWVLLLFLSLLVAALRNDNLAANLGLIKGWFVLPLAFAVLANAVMGNEKRKKMFWWLYLSAFLVSMLSFGYFLRGLVTYDGRLEAFFNSPNYLAMYLSPAVIIGFVVLGDSFFKKENNERYKTAFFIISLFSIIFSLYFTFSYASWFAIVLSLVFISLFPIMRSPREGGSDKKKYFFVGILITIVAIAVALQINTDKFRSLAALNERSSLASRVMIWESGVRILEDNWLLGIGPANFQEKYLAYQKHFPPYLEWAVPHPHNLFLYIWLSSGAMGLAGFLGIVVLWFSRILRGVKNSRWLRIPLGIMFYILILGLFDTYAKNDLSVVFWLVVFLV